MATQEELLDLARELHQEQSALRASLISAREAAGLTQQALADLLGVSQSAISQMERYDANPTVDSLRRYALAVGARLTLRAEPVKRSSSSAVDLHV